MYSDLGFRWKIRFLCDLEMRQLSYTLDLATVAKTVQTYFLNQDLLPRKYKHQEYSSVSVFISYLSDNLGMSGFFLSEKSV